MIQLDLDGFDVVFSCGYKCNSCLKYFQTMKEVSKHTTRHVRHRRKSKTINYVLEQFRLITTVNSEIRSMQDVIQIGRVS